MSEQLATYYAQRNWITINMFGYACFSLVTFWVISTLPPGRVKRWLIPLYAAVMLLEYIGTFILLAVLAVTQGGA